MDPRLAVLAWRYAARRQWRLLQQACSCSNGRAAATAGVDRDTELHQGTADRWVVTAVERSGVCSKGRAVVFHGKQ